MPVSLLNTLRKWVPRRTDGAASSLTQSTDSGRKRRSYTVGDAAVSIGDRKWEPHGMDVPYERALSIMKFYTKSSGTWSRPDSFILSVLELVYNFFA